jgi:hypothetical protein
MIAGSPELNAVHKEFKTQLFRLTKTVWGIPDETWDFLYTRENKEIPTQLLSGMSPRQALIHTSEVVIKPNYGASYFGKFAAKTLVQNACNIFSDGGFLEETVPIVDAVGASNVCVISISRPGCSFSGDSRTYLPEIAGVDRYKIRNDGSLEEFFTKIKGIVYAHVRKNSGM